jgi:hypothetical protein
MDREQASPYTDEQLDEAGADMRAHFDAYFRTPEFEARSVAATAQIEAGGLKDAESFAAALGLPVEFLEFALRKHVAAYVARNGGLN